MILGLRLKLRKALTPTNKGATVVYHGEVPYAYGGSRFIHGIYVPVYQEGHVTGLRILANDITAHRVVEERLSDEKLRSQTIIDNAIDGIVTIDAGGIIQSFNPAAERSFWNSCSRITASSPPLSSAPM